MGRPRTSEGLKIARLLMVLSSMSPLFVLWALQGVSLIPDKYLWTFCGVMFLAPNAFLYLRIRVAMNSRDVRELVVGTAEDHRDHLLVYLFPMLLPFYSTAITTWRSVGALLAAVGFVVFLFWHLNLHYMNVLFAAFGLRVFTVQPPATTNPFDSKQSYVIITRTVTLTPGERRILYRLSDTVYYEGVQNR